MKHLILALSVILLLTLTGWGEELKPGEQAHASVADHRREAKANARNRRQYHRGRGRARRRRYHRHPAA
jgi:hypothetical protein